MRRTIVTGEFATEPQAAGAVDRLLRACIHGEHVRAFFLSGPEMHRRMPARRVESQPMRRPIGRGAAIALDLGPAGVAGGVGISAYARGVGSGGDTETSLHHARILIAVETEDQVSQALAVNVLRQHGARAIERIHTPRASRAGFHPVSLSSLLEHSEPQPVAGRPTGATRH